MKTGTESPCLSFISMFCSSFCYHFFIMANVFLENIKINDVSSLEDSYIALCPFTCDIGQYGYSVIPPREFSNIYSGASGDMGFNSAKVLNNSGYTTVCFRHMPWRTVKKEYKTSSLIKVGGIEMQGIQTASRGIIVPYEYIKLTHNSKSIVFFYGDDSMASDKLPVCVNSSFYYRVDSFKSASLLFVYMGTLLLDLVGINMALNKNGLLFTSNDNNPFTFEFGYEYPFKSYPMARLFFDDKSSIRFVAYSSDGSVSTESDYGVVTEATDKFISVRMSKDGRTVTNTLDALYSNASNRTDLVPRVYSCSVMKGDTLFFDANDNSKSSVIYVEKFYAKPEYNNNYTRKIDFADSPLVSTESSILSEYEKIIYASAFQAGALIDLDYAVGGFGTFIKVETNSGSVLTIKNPDSRVYKIADWLIEEFKKILIESKYEEATTIVINSGDELFVLDEYHEDGTMSAWDKYNYINTTSYALAIKAPETGFTGNTFFVLDGVAYSLYSEYLYAEDKDSSYFGDDGFVISPIGAYDDYPQEVIDQVNENKKINSFVKMKVNTFYEISKDHKEKLLSSITTKYTESDFIEIEVPFVDRNGVHQTRNAIFTKEPQVVVSEKNVLMGLQQQLRGKGFSVEYDVYDSALRLIKTNVVVVPPICKDIIVENWVDGFEDVMIYNYDKYKAVDITSVEPRLSNDIYVKIDLYKDILNPDVSYLMTVYGKEGLLETHRISLKPYSQYYLPNIPSRYIIITMYKDKDGNPILKQLPTGTFHLGRARKIPITDEMKIANLANNKPNDIDFDVIIDGGEGGDVFKINLLNEFIDYDNLKFIYVSNPDTNIDKITTFLGFSGTAITDLVVNYNGTMVPLYVVYLSLFLNNQYCGLLKDVRGLVGTPTELYKNDIMTVYEDGYRFVLSHNFVKVYNNPYFPEFAIILTRIKRDIATTVNFQQSKNRISGQIGVLLNYFVTMHSNVIFSSNVLGVEIRGRTCKVTIETVFNAFRANPVIIDVVVDIKET